MIIVQTVETTWSILTIPLKKMSRLAHRRRSAAAESTRAPSVERRSGRLPHRGDLAIVEAKARPVAPLHFVQRSINCCSAVWRWRRRIAALLGRFLPELRAAGDSGLFSAC